ncbi:ribosome-binding factor A [Desulfohalotomaculum tongense]|uniref:30S ribosome-binding factor RbfA n=1 Tax=Desulforadius tongensis TaxID=1216062 RepID=UPI00195BD2CE|nr:30S ribosome-binding factor RbfA [Desulforadius tongensis]MBM7854440.1 ribosome-binding factor A [Desulforadius tongensis]
MSHRIGRLAEEIKREISSIIRQELKDPRIGFVSITAVEVSGDLRHAKIYVSVLGDEKQAQDTLAVLKKAQGFVRTMLGRKIKLRYTPELHFELDNSISHGVNIMKKLKEIQSDEKPPTE